MSPTRVNPVGDLLEEKLEVILDSLAGDPIYEALSMRHPERMGISHGWTVERFIEASAKGQILFQYVNPDYKVRLHPEILLAAAKAYAKK
jgi:hypothetical protein